MCVCKTYDEKHLHSSSRWHDVCTNVLVSMSEKNTFPVSFSIFSAQIQNDDSIIRTSAARKARCKLGELGQENGAVEIRQNYSNEKFSYFRPVRLVKVFFFRCSFPVFLHCYPGVKSSDGWPDNVMRAKVRVRIS